MEKRRRINKHLPTEIVEEILYNLPVKSLLRFKCVSKSWNSLISSKDFIKHHLKKSITDDTDLTDLTNHRLIITFKYGDTYFLGHGSIPLRKQPVLTPSYFHDSLGGFSIMGSCNGLLLVTTTTADLSYLWNPSTRKYKEIHPSFGIDGDDQLGQNEVIFGFPITHHYHYFYGLGYDESNNDYKVVCIRISSRGGNPIPTIMYSSKTNSWKKIENLPNRIYGHLSGRFVNGRLHWLSYSSLGGTGACNGIICLDLVEEKYEYEILVPRECSSNNANFLVPDFFLEPKLEELGGFLSLIYLKSWADIDVWVMTEYGVRESWSKIWTLSDFVDAPVVRADGRAMPFCWRKNGDIAVVFGEEIVVYNGHNVLSRSRVDMLDDKLGCVVYVESLVSPFCR